MLALDHLFCSCGGKLVRQRDDSALILVGCAALLYAALTDGPLSRIAEEIGAAALGLVVHRRDDFGRDTKALAAGLAKLDRDDPTLN